MASVARVMLDSPLPQLDRLFDYAIPPALASEVVPGVRVTAALRSERRIADGLVVDVGDTSDFDGALAPLESVVSPARVLAPEVWALARRVADRQAGSASDVLRLAIPPRSVAAEKKWLAREAPAVVPVGAVPAVEGYASSAVESAVDGRARVALRSIPGIVELPDGSSVGRWALTLAQAAARTVASGASAILAVPDYRDQEQLEAALRSVVPGELIASLDARRTRPQRYAAFLSCLDDVPRVIVGNRSVVYAPAAKLGLIALFDDGDPLFAEPLAPYAHARDVALIRQEQQSCAVMFAGHTRSVEVQRLIELHFLTELAPVPLVTPKVVPTVAQDPQSRGDAGRVPSAAFRVATEALQAGSVLVQVARPGYVSLLACRRCGQAARCTHCAGPLQLASSHALPSCAWCGRLAGGWACSECANNTYRMVTRGSGRTAEELGRAFPGTRVIVSDGERPVTLVDGEPRTLVVATRGAEPVAVGGYAAVILLDGERMLQRESLHVGDDCLRWWSNATALAAPGATTVLVGVGGPLAQALGLWQQHSYAAAQLIDRRALGFPPAVRVASVTGKPAAVQQALDALLEVPIRDVLGPAPVTADGPRTADGGLVRAVVRFDYAHGSEVATALRGAVLRGATGTRRPPAGQKRQRPAPTLRVKLDDPEIL
ncbi:primosomal protein N' [Gryllotalpicola reticulitermitis]|uniref:Primosomal protein N n=1 Tax=Gryllotalpicola reticulitermitis TaxID=1184153 RepID=A0ABV8QC70_9MICO